MGILGIIAIIPVYPILFIEKRFLVLDYCESVIVELFGFARFLTKSIYYPWGPIQSPHRKRLYLTLTLEVGARAMPTGIRLDKRFDRSVIKVE